MVPQNQVRAKNTLPDFSFHGFWHFYYLYGVGANLSYPQARVYCDQRYQSGYKVFLLFELVFMLATRSLCMVG